MKQIGFKNFRKFEEFPTIDLGEITMLVGRNSSGKSTLVKALLLILDNLKQMPINPVYPHNNIIRFDENQYTDLNINTFHRALNNDAKLKGINRINFYLTIGSFTYNFIVQGDLHENNNYGVLTNLKIISNSTSLGKYEIEIDFLRNERSIIRYANVNESDINKLSELAENLERKLEELKSKDNDIELELKIIESSNELVNIKNKIATLRDSSSESQMMAFVPFLRLENGIESIVKNIELIKDDYLFLNDDKEEILDVLEDSGWFVDSETGEVITSDEEGLMEYEATKEFLESYQVEISNIAHTIRKELSEFSILYIYAHGINQRSIYSIHDKNDFIARTLHEYNKVSSSKTKSFIREWMKKFEIGENFTLKNYLNEAYSVQIKKSKVSGEKDETIGLADLGMGSIQIMVILFRLATILSHQMTSKQDREYIVNTPTIIIEEPEQNLHPALQSRLAELFYEINREYGARFIIETHSEYLIRKTQVEVSKHKGEEWINPFAVYYFPVVGNPYIMEYRADGKFSNEFGKGFFDEAAELAFQIF